MLGGPLFRDVVVEGGPAPSMVAWRAGAKLDAAEFAGEKCGPNPDVIRFLGQHGQMIIASLRAVATAAI